MLRPLFCLVFAEVFVILLLLFKTPLQKPLLLLLDRTKRDRILVVASTAGGILFLILVSILYGIIMDGSPLNATDQFILAYHLHEASLLGVALFLGLMIHRLHYYMKEHMETVRRLDQMNDGGKNK